MRTLLLTCVAMMATGFETTQAPKPAKSKARRPAETMRVRWASKPWAKEKPYQVKRMKNNPTIDADWNKPAWKDVKPLTLEYYMGEEPKHQPKVQAKAAYDADNVYVIWRVEDNYVLAQRTKHQDDVYKDSCVEFFFTPGRDPKKLGYFNLETNCNGVMLFYAHVPGIEGGKFTAEDFAKVTIASSLKGPIDPEIAKPTSWTLEYKLPLSLLEKYAKVQRPGPGVTWRANFYKCADDTSHPHWLTWAPVNQPMPSFHIPRYFGMLSFE